MGFYCTSSIEVVKKDEKICVTFYSDHRDHNLDFNSQVHMTLPKSEQDKIAGMITQGIEHDIILDRVRESAGSNRMSFLEKKDIDNICVRYGLNKTHSRHSDDSTSVRLIVKEMQDANEVLYFKDQGDVDSDNPEIPSKEFVLGFMKGGQELIFSTQMKSCDKIQVCMDSTHCISQYSGFQLTTLMILTDLNKGFPVAFLISSSVNTSILKAFLNSVKKRMGQVRAYTFMSDDDPVFRNAWDATMGRDMNLPVKYINCSWHTDRSFRKNIASKISAPFMEKLSVYQMVRVLMDEQEENEFHKQCKGFLSYMLEAGFERFHDYFKENYLCENRIQLWPQCYPVKVAGYGNELFEKCMANLNLQFQLCMTTSKETVYTLSAAGILRRFINFPTTPQETELKQQECRTQ
ncbi:uncharacterized protein LOC127002553 [Eriocheir sinensis]|uniref:uncharacterized protein LOC127002553 n=1 Tax=Eriocheir sinensis TaxID=95602 RepID=UPI0021CA4F81|nr:uncharacterized protein LOC127002553 [Eriocheir sinensis]